MSVSLRTFHGIIGRRKRLLVDGKMHRGEVLSATAGETMRVAGGGAASASWPVRFELDGKAERDFAPDVSRFVGPRLRLVVDNAVTPPEGYSSSSSIVEKTRGDFALAARLHSVAVQNKKQVRTVQQIVKGGLRRGKNRSTEARRLDLELARLRQRELRRQRMSGDKRSAAGDAG